MSFPVTWLTEFQLADECQGWPLENAVACEHVMHQCSFIHELTLDWSMWWWVWRWVSNMLPFVPVFHQISSRAGRYPIVVMTTLLYILWQPSQNFIRPRSSLKETKNTHLWWEWTPLPLINVELSLLKKEKGTSEHNPASDYISYKTHLLLKCSCVEAISRRQGCSENYFLLFYFNTFVVDICAHVYENLTFSDISLLPCVRTFLLQTIWYSVSSNEQRRRRNKVLSKDS